MKINPVTLLSLSNWHVNTLISVYRHVWLQRYVHFLGNISGTFRGIGIWGQLAMLSRHAVASGRQAAVNGVRRRSSSSAAVNSSCHGTVCSCLLSWITTLCCITPLPGKPQHRASRSHSSLQGQWQICWPLHSLLFLRTNTDSIEAGYWLNSLGSGVRVPVWVRFSSLHQRGGSPTVIILSLLYRSRYFSFK
jgi:hypothetical protein